MFYKTPRILAVILLVSFMSVKIMADQSQIDLLQTSTVTDSKFDKKAQVEFKAGYFFFSDSTMRKIFKSGGLDLQLSGSYPICNWLQAYASVEYLHRDGSSLSEQQKTSIWEIPVSMGLKPIFTISPNVQYYMTLGPRYFYVHEHNRSTYVNRIVVSNVFGCFVNTGFQFTPINHLLLDLFGEYSYGQAHTHDSNTNIYGRTIQVGGFSFGGGLGYEF